MNWDDVKPKLQQKLDPKHVKPAPRGKFGDYVDGYHCITEANRIFGEDGWSYEIVRLQLVSEQTVSLSSKNGNYEQYRVGYLCTVKVRVGDTYKEGAAVGVGLGDPKALADHHESAVKEAETDALKRALRSYGNTFGLALYDKDKSQVGVDTPPFDPAGYRDRVKREVERAPTMQDLQEVWRKELEDLNRLKDQDPPKYNELTKAKDTRKAELTPPDPALQAPDGYSPEQMQ